MPSILKNHQFLRLWGNQILLQVAFNMSNFTALLIIADRTHSPFVQAQFYTALTIPAIIFGFIAGPVVDMVERKILMLITDALLAVLFLLYLFAGSNVLFFLVIAFLTSGVARFFIPAEAATIPLLVDKKILNHANSFFLFTLMGSILLGYSIAGPLIQLFGGLGTVGEKVPFIVASIFLVIGFILRLSLEKVEFRKPDLPAGTVIVKTMHLFMQTVDEVVSNKRVSLSLALLVFVELMMGLLSVVLLEYVRIYLGLPITSITYVLIGPLIVGLFLGVGFLGKVEESMGRRKSIFIALIILGFLLSVIGISPIIVSLFDQSFLIIRAVAVISAFFMGILVVLIAVQARTILQLNANETMHGRIFSFLDVMIAFVTPIPVLLTGFLADSVSVLTTLIFAGGMVIALTYFSHKFILSR
ncbi:MAG: MFS transporter [Patescibacteria group bacterium]